MTAPARLTTVRLQGFKSFAERTQLVFGPGVSAVVGPNGSGKSNLADALRWALGEQGRALRSRKAEDVIWAGSENRAAIGMAEVQLVLDNGDGLLPVDFAAVELGRRLYRSGENEYLLNRQRVRLRDQVDLLDAAHLADNAFLFIGQGMVDQALALRPEERRPLFEEVAGVRRHERRRRRGEEQLAEALDNLERVEDILAELRPQVRRLSVQAEQQASRAGAAGELVEALLAIGWVRWHAAAGRRTAATRRTETARSAADAALAELAEAEMEATRLAGALAARGLSAEVRRATVEAATRDVNDLRLRDGRAASDLEAAARERGRLTLELAALEADLVTHRGRADEPLPERDHALEAALTDAERALAEALAELEAIRSVTRAGDADALVVRRAAAARAAEAETVRRRLADAERAAESESRRLDGLDARHLEAAAASSSASAARTAAEARAQAAAQARTEAVRAVEVAEAAAGVTGARAAAAAANAAGLSERAAVASAAIEADDGDELARSARAAGGGRIDEGVEVEPSLRRAVDAALGPIGRAWLVAEAAVPGLAGNGTVVVGAGPDAAGPIGEVGVAVVAAATAVGGGSLEHAVRRDPRGVVRLLLARVVWTPDLAGAIGLRARLPVGWIAVPRDGGAVVGPHVVRLRPDEGSLARRAEAERAVAVAAAARAEAERLGSAASDGLRAVEAARLEAGAARSAEATAIAELRAAEGRERTVARDLETVARERAWLRAQADRLAADVERLRAALPVDPPPGAAGDGPPGPPGPGDAHVALDRRVTELRTRREVLARDVGAAEATRREVDRRRTAAEAALGLAIARRAAVEAAVAELDERLTVAEGERDELAGRIAVAMSAERDARSALAAELEADAAERARLSAVESEAGAAREALRTAEEAARAAERDELEASLALEGIREQLLAELSGIGEAAFAGLGLAVERPAPAPETADGAADPSAEDAGDIDLGRLGDALDSLALTWAASAPTVSEPPPGRMTTLRRRFHEFGTVNPYAADELGAVRARLDGLETQQADLRTAIDTTRSLIAELDRLIAEQFRATFRALETAFDARFRQLFGGGFARLSLTDPADLAATGVEIVARPPGKKPQALAMLSGGERALTAVALLFAMLEVRPVPFCVLDEVDAALDEANVGRFTSALRELAAQTQFIVITHNRGTIEMADALYGVTVGEDSVSRVVSLRLEEATAIAEASRHPAIVAVGPGRPEAPADGFGEPLDATSDGVGDPLDAADPFASRTG